MASTRTNAESTRTNAEYRRCAPELNKKRTGDLVGLGCVGLDWIGLVIFPSSNVQKLTTDTRILLVAIKFPATAFYSITTKFTHGVAQRRRQAMKSYENLLDQGSKVC